MDEINGKKTLIKKECRFYNSNCFLKGWRAISRDKIGRLMTREVVSGVGI